MDNNLKIKRELLSPPGETIQETIDSIGMNQYELADRLGKNIKNVNRIIKGKEAITASTALALERVLGIPADFWIERERQFRIELTQLELEEQMLKSIKWLKKFPVAAMMKLGWINSVTEPVEIIKELLSFFGIAAPEQWSIFYTNETANVAYKLSLAHTSDPEAISVWLRKGELDAKKNRQTPFNKVLFKQNLSKIKELAFNHPSDFKEQLQELCSEAGVAVVYTPSIPKAAISGATRWISNSATPLIQLSGRYKTNDHFWFTFFHEAGHILLHGKKDVFLEEVNGVNSDTVKEKEADTFARQSLISEN